MSGDAGGGAEKSGWEALYPFAPHRLAVDGGQMHYVDEGPRAPGAGGGPLLFVHGNPTWSFYWRRLIAEFSPEARCVAPDHIGCGRSDKPQDWPYRMEGHGRNLERLLLELDLRDVTLVVHDWGGAIGLWVAGRHPERFSRLAILNTAAFPSTEIPWRIAACRLPVLGELAVRGLNGFAGAAVYMATERGLAPDVRAGLLAPYADWASRIATHRFVLDIPMAPTHPTWPTICEAEAGLAWLAHCPTALIWGERDWCFTPAFREGFKRRMPWAREERIAEAGHYVVEDAPDRVIAAIRALRG